MCGRYVLEFDHDVYLGGEPLGADIHNFNVAPTTTVPILLERFTEESFVPTREIYPVRWGLLPGWAKDASFSARTFNARSETLFEKPSFRHAALNGHCAIPVSGYYEWKTEQLTSGKQTKTPYFIHRSDDQPIYFAGLYECWKITAAEANKPDSPYAKQESQWVLSCSIITMDAPDEYAIAELASQGHPEETPLALSQLHNRLPVPLHFDGTNTDNLTLWLRSGKTPGQTNPPNSDALAIRTRKSLQTITENAYPQTSHWALHPVTTAVGNIRNNGPQLTQPTQDLLTELT